MAQKPKEKIMEDKKSNEQLLIEYLRRELEGANELISVLEHELNLLKNYTEDKEINIKFDK